VWNLPTYGEETDARIRKIAALCSRRELLEWWDREIGWQVSSTVASEKSERLYENYFGAPKTVDGNCLPKMVHNS
jgi:hypothetical protein